MTAVIALSVVAVFMLGELWLSNANERALRARGAVTPSDPVFSTMRWAYPAVFVVMAGESFLRDSPSSRVIVAGAVVFAGGKLLKGWAIASLGERWTYKVLVLPGVPLVSSGPYRFLRHPNYVGVVAELVGVALVAGARVTGPLGLAFFSWLLVRRIRAEETALSTATPEANHSR